MIKLLIAAAVMVGSLPTTFNPVMAEDQLPPILFGIKTFVDVRTTVHVEGTLTGEGVAYKENRVALTCYEETRQCLKAEVATTGRQVMSIGLIDILETQVFSSDKIIADYGGPCGVPPNDTLKSEWQGSTSSTWIIDRKRETAELIHRSCLGSKTYHWTIEDPEWQKSARIRLIAPNTKP